MRILIAEDDSISRRILEATLVKWGYDVTVTRDGDEAWDALKHPDAPNLVILDWMMPGMDGVDICRRIRTRISNDYSYTYVILLTTKGQKGDIIEGMEAGADDYITKPFDAGELRVRLHAAERMLDLESKLLTAQEALRHEALHDSLTGLWNRTAILETLERELARSKRQGGSVGVIVVDIDHFKEINDTCGHRAGDTMLCKTTHVMQANLRAYDMLGRYGGEEFLIVMPGCDLTDAAARAEGIRAQVAATEVPLMGKRISVTVSMGVAASCDYDRPSTDTLIQAADEAMYRAKHQGRNRVETVGEVAPTR